MAAPMTLRRIAWPLAAAVAITLAAVASAFAAASEADLAAFVRRAVDEHVRPLHRDFAARSEDLRVAAVALCDAPSAEGLRRVEAALDGAILAVSALEVVRVGPIASRNRRERLDYWPDARGRGLAEVRRILAAETPEDLDVAVLAAKSVAVQGLPAFEYLLLGDGAGAMSEPGSFRCAYARAIAANVAAIGREMAAEWAVDDGAAALLLAPGPDNPLYRDHAEAAGAIVGGIATAMEIIADQKITAILGSDPAKPRPRLAPWWRSSRTFAAFAATVGSAHRLFAVSGARDLLAPDDRWIARAVDFQFANADRVLAPLGPDVAAVVAEPAGRETLGYLRIVTRDIKGAVGVDFAKAIGLTRGFNALDGD
jgi:predicted lipoprotein